MAAFFRLIDPHGNEYEHVQDHSLQLALEELDQQIEVIQQQERQLKFRKRAIDDARQEVLQQIQHRKFRQYLHEREQEARLQEYYLEELQERRAFEQVIRTIIQKRYEDDETQRNVQREKEARRLLRRILVSDPSNTQLVVPRNFHQFFINHPIVEHLNSSDEQPRTIENTEYPQRTSQPVQYGSPITRKSDIPTENPKEFHIRLQQPLADEGPHVAEIPHSHEKAHKHSHQAPFDDDLTHGELTELNEYLLGAQRRLNKRGNAREHHDPSQALPGTFLFGKMANAPVNPDPEVIEPEEEIPTQRRNPLETLLSSGHYSVVNSDDESGPPEYQSTQSEKQSASPNTRETVFSATSETPHSTNLQPEHHTTTPSMEYPSSNPSNVPTNLTTNDKKAASNQPNGEQDNASSTRPVSQSSVRHNVTVEEVPDEDA
ncbi:Schizosaccharomyces specific protein Slt1 [Schizosaccharomyces osmophilus]|uniref:Schizosaccharomyces specific protein Slt1 n=1 Tax=Schizosaccharomyces osmophilus TaxID=2545709 RepID=A0AAF0AXU4_9SCHI|nr:Schizosaccharomyces specific protein Slt1 [Schizosaccharomyces osmophilus]WBW74298.1 Schizosaccharomyces specific protein Slt1 [Schizosaccharomyces osmophilus]